MKHKHHDLICQWAADTSRKVEWSQNGGRTWHALSSVPLWDESVEYRFADEVLRYRVALFKSNGEESTSTCESEIAAAGYSFELHRNFIRWITDWIEVTEPVVEEPKTVKREAWLALTADGECAVFEDEVNARHFVINHGVECRHIEWEVPA